jgi:hypothetical protein
MHGTVKKWTERSIGLMVLASFLVMAGPVRACPS